MSSPVSVGTSMASVISLQQVGELPGDHVLQPGHLERLQGLAQADATADVDVSEVVGAQRNLVADPLADLGHVFRQQGDPFVRELDSREGVLRVEVSAPVGICRLAHACRERRGAC